MLGFARKTISGARDDAALNGANANNEDRSRTYVELTANSLRGVIGKVFRACDSFAVAAVRDDNSLVEYDKAVVESLSLLEQKLVAQTDLAADPLAEARTNTVGGALENLERALNGFRNNPNNADQKEAVRVAAKKLVAAVKQADSYVVEVENTLKAKVENSVVRVNELLGTIGKLTKDIARNEGSGRRLFDLEDQWDKAVRDLSCYIPVEVQLRSEQVNGFERRTREVLIKREDGLAAGDIVVGGPNPPLVVGDRLLVNAKGETMKFFAEHIAGNNVRVDGLSIAEQAPGAAGVRIGVGPGLAVGNAGPTAFEDYLKRNSVFGGSLACDLNLLGGSVLTGAEASAAHRTIPQYKQLLNELVGGVLPPGPAGPPPPVPIGGIVRTFNAANGGANDLFAGNDVATFALSPGWLGAPNELQHQRAQQVADCMTNENAIVFGGVGGPDTTFIGFYNRLSTDLGRDIYAANANKKAHTEALEVDKDRRNETSAVDLSGEAATMSELDSLFRFVLETVRLVLGHLRLCVELMR
jgi:hypothetical protein